MLRYLRGQPNTPFIYLYKPFLVHFEYVFIKHFEKKNENKQITKKDLSIIIFIVFIISYYYRRKKKTGKTTQETVGRY